MTATPLLATCWSSAGNTRPPLTPSESPEPIEKRVAAVAAAGYVGMGLEYADLAVVRDTIGMPALRELFADHGLRTIEIELIDDWYTDGERRLASDRRRADLLEWASELGAHHIKTGGGRDGDEVDSERLREEFRRLAEEAEQHGTLISLEPGAFSRLKDFSEAAAMVRDVDHRAGTLLVDVWHLFRTDYDYGRLPEDVPAWALTAVELDDGLAEHGDDLLADTLDNRVLSGRGDFRVREFVEAIRAIGYEGVWGVEHMSVAHRALPIGEALAEARDAALSVLA